LGGESQSANAAFLARQTFVYSVYRYIYTVCFSQLASFPGPKLWAASRIPSQLSVLRGRVHIDVTALHKRYGPVVRIGPNELAFNTAQAFSDIYEDRAFAKDRNHYMPPANEVDHLVCAVDDADHIRQRKLLSHAFSDRALRGQEGLITDYVDTLIQKLKDQLQQRDGKNAQTTVDIKQWLNFTTFDILGDLMFGESFNCLQGNQLHPWIALLFNSIKALSVMGVANQFPFINAILQKLIPESIKQQGLDHFNLSAHKVDSRLRMLTDRPDFMSSLLKNGLSDSDKKNEEDVKTLSRAELHSNAFMYVFKHQARKYLLTIK
jgi:cytochrome P450